MSKREHAPWCQKADRIGVKTVGVYKKTGLAKVRVTTGTCGCHLSRTATLLRRLRLRAEKREAE